MHNYLIVFFGAGIGGVMRHWTNIAAMRLLGAGFPWGTLAVNVAGSLAMGILVAWFAQRSDPGEAWRLFLATGLLGGFTTFSAFSLDAALLYDRGQPAIAALYVIVSVIVALAGLFGGRIAVRLVM